MVQQLVAIRESELNLGPWVDLEVKLGLLAYSMFWTFDA